MMIIKVGNLVLRKKQNIFECVYGFYVVKEIYREIFFKVIKKKGVFQCRYILVVIVF